MAVPAQYGYRISCFRIDVSSALSTSAEDFLYLLPAIGITSPVELKTKNIYFIRGTFQSEDIEVIACRLICDAVLDSYEIRQVGVEAQRPPENTVYSSRTQIGVRELEVSLRPGVTDNTAAELLRAIRGLGYAGVCSAATGKRYEFSGDIADGDLHLIAKSYLVNETIESYVLGEIQPEFSQASPSRHLPELFNLDSLDNEGLIDLSRERRLALDLDEMSAIRSYFRSVGRPVTDAELEMIAQSWSEHCIHKTFKALITISQPDEKHHANLDETQQHGAVDQVDSILNTYLQSVTDSIRAPWVRSAFVDNAGVIEFDSTTDLSFKVETHNHPSALEPFGGANTMIGSWLT